MIASITVFEQFHQLEPLDLSRCCSWQQIGSNNIVSHSLILWQLAAQIIEVMSNRLSGISYLFLPQIFKIRHDNCSKLFGSNAGVRVADPYYREFFNKRGLEVMDLDVFGMDILS